MDTRGSYMYVHNSVEKKIQGHPENVSFMQFSQNIDGFRQKPIHKTFRTHTTQLFLNKTH